MECLAEAVGQQELELRAVRLELEEMKADMRAQFAALQAECPRQEVQPSAEEAEEAALVEKAKELNKLEVKYVDTGAPAPQLKSFLSFTGNCRKGRVLLLGRIREIMGPDVEVRSNHLVLLVVGENRRTVWTAQERVTVSLPNDTLDCEVVSAFFRAPWVCIVEPLGPEKVVDTPPTSPLHRSPSLTGDVAVLHDHLLAITCKVEGEHKMKSGPLPVSGARPGDLVFVQDPQGAYQPKGVVIDSTAQECWIFYLYEGLFNNLKANVGHWYREKHPDRTLKFHYPYSY